jgi:NADH-quinone oxidoreductase subunit J
MLAHTIFFYFFSIIAIFSSLMVITSRNTVNSVFFLILDFISVGCLFIMVGAEFLGMIILIVYVGAVAVLFLFVVMMLNVAEQKQSWFIGKKSTHIPIGLIVSVLILLELLVVVGGWKYKDNLMSSSTLGLSNISNTHQLGLVMYTDYILYFQLAGIILLLSMIGAILLTFRQRKGVKKQSYFTQISREPSTSIELFFLGTIGIFLNRKNVIVILMSIELILLAVNINLISFSIFSGDIVGQIFTMLILTIAAAEAAIGLAIIVIYYRNKGSIRVEDIHGMKG